MEARHLRGRRSERFEKVEGEQIGFLRKILGAFPVGRLNSLLRLIEEAANFVDHILLRVVEVATVGMVQILLRGSYVLSRLLL